MPSKQIELFENESGKSSCVFSPDRLYRYELWRNWADIHGPDGYVNFIGLNPSTADEDKDDPTIRRCIDFAKKWGFAGLCMTNLFAFRSTNPNGLTKVGPSAAPGVDNLDHLVRVARGAGLVIAAWGKSVPMIKPRALIVQGLFEKFDIKLHCLRKNSDGSPEHPLYIPATTKPIIYG